MQLDIFADFTIILVFILTLYKLRKNKKTKISTDKLTLYLINLKIQFWFGMAEFKRPTIELLVLSVNVKLQQ